MRRVLYIDRETNPRRGYNIGKHIYLKQTYKAKITDIKGKMTVVE